MGKIPFAIIGVGTGGGREISIGVKATGGELVGKISVDVLVRRVWLTLVRPHDEFELKPDDKSDILQTANSCRRATNFGECAIGGL